MNISQKSNQYNTRRAVLKNNPYFLANNELPYWQGNPKSKSDLIATVILTELVSLKYDSGSDDEDDFELKDCFAHFWKRFNINKLQMQRATCHLHQAGIVSLLI